MAAVLLTGCRVGEKKRRNNCSKGVGGCLDLGVPGEL